MHRNTNLIVGLVIIGSLVILIGGVRFLKESKSERSFYDVKAVFPNVGTLTEGDPVKINGVKKGKVKTINLHGQKVEVVMSIEKGVTLTEDSRVVIQNIGLMGERMIGIQLGSGTPMATDRVFPGSFDSGIAEAMGMLGDVLVDVQGTVKELQKIVNNTVGSEKFQTTFAVTIERLDSTTKVLTRLVTGNQEPLQRSIDDLSATAGNVRTFFDKNKGRLDNTVENVEQITVQGKSLLAKADSITANLNQLLDLVNSDQSSIGRMLKDTAFVNNLKTTIISADSLVRNIKDKGIKVGFW